jgi:hypothetical protein
VIELLLEAERAMAVGMLDQAERLYRQVADSDARNSIAVVGLARIALERGDEDAALSLGARALAIDPDNVAARRLVDRLVEVRAHRTGGAPVPSADVPPAPTAPPDEPAADRSGDAGRAREAGEPDAAGRKPSRLRRFFRRG